MNAPFKPVPRGPQNGSPPSLEFVQLDRLHVDPAYQRATDGPLSRRLIVGMVRSWEWPLCQPLVVARRADVSLWVLDGQHRLNGARQRGDIHHLPCVILPALAAADEARAFVDLNTRRQKLSQTDIFNGRLAAGDENAKATAALLEETGWRIVRSSATDSWKPGDLICAPMIADQRRIHGEAIVHAALTTLRRAYPDTVVSAPANIIRALVQLYRPGGPAAPADTPRVAAAMSKVAPSRWLIRAARLRDAQPELTVVAAIVQAIADALDPDSKDAGLVSASAPPPDTAKPVLLTDAKGWCEQCESLVTPQGAAKCGSPFCKMQEAKAA